MIIDKNEIEKEYKKAQKGALVFFIISMSLFGITLALVIVSIIVGAKDGQAWFPFGYASGICMSLAFTFIILRSVFFTSKMRMLIAIEQAESQPAPQGQAPIVDAQPVEAFKEESSRENKLFQQYENLHKQGYITDEELEQKRKELLGK